MDWRLILYPALLFLFLWICPYVWIIFQRDVSQTARDTTVSDRRLIRLCLRGLIAVIGALLLHWCLK